jgi:hypothetical protein
LWFLALEARFGVGSRGKNTALGWADSLRGWDSEHDFDAMLSLRRQFAGSP